MSVLKPYPILTLPLLESQPCQERVWLFIEKLPPIMSHIFKSSSMANEEKEESYPIPAGNSS